MTLIMIKLPTDNQTVTIVSTYAPQQGLVVDIKDKLYEDLISLVSKVGENGLITLGGELKGHVGEDSNGYDEIHGGLVGMARNLERERILEMGSALDMIVCNTFFRKRDTRLITYKSGPFKIQIDYIMVRNKDRKRVRDVKVITGEEFAQHHQLLICYRIICAVKEVKKPFVPKRKVWRLNEDTNTVEFKKEFQRLAQVSSQKTDVGIWKSIKEDLLASSDTACVWTKGPPNHRVTWRWNDNVDIVKENRRLLKSWKQGGSKEDYLEAKRTARRAVYDAKRAAELKRFGNVLRRRDDRAEVFKITKQMTTTNPRYCL